MRQAYFNIEFINNSKGDLIGLNMGYDSVHEHEGVVIEGIRNALGIPLLKNTIGSYDTVGIDRHLAPNVSAGKIVAIRSSIELEGYHFFSFTHRKVKVAVMMINYGVPLSRAIEPEIANCEKSLRKLVIKSLKNESLICTEKYPTSSMWDGDGVSFIATGDGNVRDLIEIDSFIRAGKIVCGQKKRSIRQRWAFIYQLGCNERRRKEINGSKRH